MMLMTPSVPATSISRRLRVPSKTLMLALFHAKQVIPKREKRKKKNRQKIRRGPKLEGCAFANFGNSSGTEGEPSQKRGKKKKVNAATTRNRTRDPSITDQMSVLTN